MISNVTAQCSWSRLILFMTAFALLPGADVLLAASDNSLPLARISIQQGRFVLDSKREFKPFGFNYIRLRRPSPGQVDHATFGPDMYDGKRAERMLEDLAAKGFNTVRVFIDATSREVGLIPSREATSLSAVYMENVCDFLKRAGEAGIYVIIAFNEWGPVNDWLIQGESPWPQVSGANLQYFRPGAAETRAKMLAEFVRAIKNRNPELLPVVLAYEIQNELAFFMDAEPLSLKGGTFRYQDADYGLFSDPELQSLLDDVAVNWCNASVEAVKRIDPEALVSVSLFTYHAVGRSGPGKARSEDSGDRRVPARPLALAGSKLDYLDIHFYPHQNDTLQRDRASIEWDRLAKACQDAGKPIIMGEFGAFKAGFDNPESAAKAVVQHLKRVLDMGCQGALYWTYDCNEQERLWNARSRGGVILNALSKEVVAALGKSE